MILVKSALAGAAILLVAALCTRRAQTIAAVDPQGVAAAPSVVLHVRAPDAAAAIAGSADGSAARPFGSISEAIRAAPASARIEIAAGTYRERLALRQPVSLVGAGAATTRIVCPAEHGTAIALFSGGTSLSGLAVEGCQLGVEIEGGRHSFTDFALRGQSQAGLRARNAEVSISGSELIDIDGGRAGAGLELDGGSLRAKDLVLRRAGRRAVLLRGARATLSDLDVEGSSLSAVQATANSEVDVQRGSFVGEGGAALFASSSRLRLSGSRIEHNEMGVVAFRGADVSVESATILDHQIAGVAISSASGSVRRSLVMRGGTDAAVSINDSPSVTLEECQLFEPGPVGVHITRSKVSIRGCDIRGAQRDRRRDFGDGIFAVEADLVLWHNVFRGNTGSGLALAQTTARLEANDFLGNGRAGVLLFDRSDATLVQNLFAGNAAAGLEVVERSKATLRDNRFGETPGVAIDAACAESARRGSARLAGGNTFGAGVAPPQACD